MQKEAGSAWSFPVTPNTVLQQVLQPSNSNQCPHFMLPPPFQRISHPPDQDQPNNKWMSRDNKSASWNDKLDLDV